ncbi:hypothetical protein ACIRQP_41590 [Streptomyces sp. NPDC102274]|uniref:hypothetical protein n=1 Tax=Streptomyces sp. NPDC102274 TaxID=3366151 RepID=UPI00380DD237
MVDAVRGLGRKSAVVCSGATEGGDEGGPGSASLVGAEAVSRSVRVRCDELAGDREGDRAEPAYGRQAQANDLRTQIGELQTRLREAESHLEHLAITRKTVTGLADRLPDVPPDLPEHPDYPRILAVFNEATGPLRAKDICEALDHNLLPKNIEGTRAKLKRLVKLGILTEVDTASFAKKQ